MPEKSIQIRHLQASWLKRFLNKSRRGAELMQHLGGELTRHFAADMNAELVFFLNQQQPRISPLLEVEPRLLGVGLVLNPIAPAHEKILQVNFVSGVAEIIFADAFPINGAEISTGSA